MNRLEAWLQLQTDVYYAPLIQRLSLPGRMSVQLELEQTIGLSSEYFSIHVRNLYLDKMQGDTRAEWPVIDELLTVCNSKCAPPRRRSP